MVAALAYSIASRCQRQCRRVDARRPAAQRRQAVHPGARQSPRAACSAIRPRWRRCCATGTPTSARRSSRTGGSPSTSPKRSASTRTSIAWPASADVTDVLTVAVMAAGFMGHEVDFELNMQGVKAFRRLAPRQREVRAHHAQLQRRDRALRTRARRLIEHRECLMRPAPDSIRNRIACANVLIARSELAAACLDVVRAVPERQAAWAERFSSLKTIRKRVSCCCCCWKAANTACSKQRTAWKRWTCCAPSSPIC